MRPIWFFVEFSLTIAVARGWKVETPIAIKNKKAITMWIPCAQIKPPSKIEEEIKPPAIIFLLSCVSPKYPNIKENIDLMAIWAVNIKPDWT